VPPYEDVAAGWHNGPHHLLAADLIARGFWAADSSKIDRVVLLSPDHFSKAAHAFATSLRPFETVFGSVEPDRTAVTSFLANRDLFEASDFVSARTRHCCTVALRGPFLSRSQDCPYCDFA
jgi:AmmeMemoRadiSam system protein B